MLHALFAITCFLSLISSTSPGDLVDIFPDRRGAGLEEISLSTSSSDDNVDCRIDFVKEEATVSSRNVSRNRAFHDFVWKKGASALMLGQLEHLVQLAKSLNQSRQWPAFVISNGTYQWRIGHQGVVCSFTDWHRPFTKLDPRWSVVFC